VKHGAFLIRDFFRRYIIVIIIMNKK